MAWTINVDHDKQRGVTMVLITGQYAGMSRCSPEDEWDDFEGTIRAFDRAVAQFPREVRKELWKVFWRKFERPQSHRYKKAA